MVVQTIVGTLSTLSLSPLSSLAIIIIAWKREKKHRKAGLWIIGLEISQDLMIELAFCCLVRRIPQLKLM